MPYLTGERTPYNNPNLRGSLHSLNPSTKIDYSISEPTNIKISIFDVMGRLVEVIDNSHKLQGDYSFLWNASNKSSGIYYISIQSDNELKTQKVVLLK